MSVIDKLKKVLHRRRDGNSDPSAILSFFCTEETLLILRLVATGGPVKTGAHMGMQEEHTMEYKNLVALQKFNSIHN